MFRGSPFSFLCSFGCVHFRTCLHKKYVWIFEHNFVADKAKIRRRAVARQVFFTQYAAKFAEKTLVYACEDRFLFPDAVIAVLFIHPSRQNPGLHGEYQQQQRQQAEHISAQCPGDIGDEIFCRGMSGCR